MSLNIKKKLLKLFYSFLIASFVFGPTLTLGSGSIGDQLQRVGENADYYEANVPDEDSLVVAVGEIINIILSFLGIIFIVLLIYGGFMWMTARGNETQVMAARKIIIRSIIGVIIILISFVVTWFVMGTLSDVIDEL